MSKTRSNLVISHMNQEERRHWASWIGMIAEGVAGVMAVNGGIPASRDVPDPGPARTRRPLTETEKRIIEHQGTEPPFSGEFVSFFEPGIYSCRKCIARFKCAVAVAVENAYRPGIALGNNHIQVIVAVEISYPH